MFIPGSSPVPAYPDNHSNGGVMPDFQYQPPTGPLSGSEFERQTTRFFQQVQGAADAAQSTAIAAQSTANEAIERAQASNLVDGKTTQADAGGVITAKDVAIEGDIEDLASARGQIGNAKPLGSGFDFSTGMIGSLPGQYYANAAGSTNAPFNGPYVELVMGLPTNKASLLLNAGRQDVAIPRAAIRSHLDTTSNNILSEYNRVITEQQIGDGLTNTNGIISVPEYDGATASTAGTSGLVPPAAAGQATYVLCGDGEWRDIATLVAAAQARLAESVKAEEGAL